jgi:hypothetical protein
MPARTNSVRWLAPLGILAAGLVLSSQTSPAKPDYTRRTSKDCEFCHPPNSRSLNDAGRYYQEHKNSLVGYKPAPKAEKPAQTPQSAPPASAKSK